jgi:hypothetical protein
LGMARRMARDKHRAGSPNGRPKKKRK